MNFKAIWTNYKIYAFLLGIILGTIIYNLLGIDFSFENIQKIELTNFFEYFMYMLTYNLRFWIPIFIISFFRIKDKLLPLIIFYQSFLISGIVTVSINSHTTLLFSGIIIAIFKIISAICMFDNVKKTKGKALGFLLLILGTFLQIFFYKTF